MRTRVDKSARLTTFHLETAQPITMHACDAQAQRTDSYECDATRAVYRSRFFVTFYK